MVNVLPHGVEVGSWMPKDGAARAQSRKNSLERKADRKVCACCAQVDLQSLYCWKRETFPRFQIISSTRFDERGCTERKLSFHSALHLMSLCLSRSLHRCISFFSRRSSCGTRLLYCLRPKLFLSFVKINKETPYSHRLFCFFFSLYFLLLLVFIRTLGILINRPRPLLSSLRAFSFFFLAICLR